MNNDIKNKIRSNHKVSWDGIQKILHSHKTFEKWPFWSCIIVSVISCIAIPAFWFDQSYNILKTLAELTLSVFPNLLGFTLGGYAIVVGFSNTELIKKSTHINKHSVYQILSAIFAICTLFQVFIVLYSFAITFLMKIDLCNLFHAHNPMLNGTVNIFALLILIFGSLYSLMLTPFIVLNLFTLSQLNNMHYTIEAYNDRQRRRTNTGSNTGNQTQ